MKIDPGFRPLGQERARADQTGRAVQARNFADAMLEQDRERTQEEMQQKLQDIQRQGDRLARSMTVRELKLYKQMIKQFLELTARKGVALSQRRGTDRRGRTKRYQLLEEIDSKLVTLAEELLGSEQGRIELLQRIGEIRGLLINFVF